MKTLADLRPHMLDEIESFFLHYARLNGKNIEIVGRKGPKRAHRLLKDGMKLARRSKR